VAGNLFYKLKGEVPQMEDPDDGHHPYSLCRSRIQCLDLSPPASPPRPWPTCMPRSQAPAGR
jgi:hypothetical protein